MLFVIGSTIMFTKFHIQLKSNSHKLHQIHIDFPSYFERTVREIQFKINLSKCLRTCKANANGHRESTSAKYFGIANHIMQTQICHRFTPVAKEENMTQITRSIFATLVQNAKRKRIGAGLVWSGFTPKRHDGIKINFVSRYI